jgi:hypothetical protein
MGFKVSRSIVAVVCGNRPLLPVIAVAFANRHSKTRVYTLIFAGCWGEEERMGSLRICALTKRMPRGRWNDR